ncbi:hypothetical protein FGO68_gene5533 [Halteria grandinella]|uniref:Uncharacterized protein n=1 Tax=Halteria grandinella TaxID=5974 RepID=A0A8J8NLL1_HALGN|nr:hypothetical protein FGO68_gene5533 [Halteria grandinella]
MGNTYCAGAREKVEEKQKATLEFYSRVTHKVKRKYDKAKNKTKENYCIAKLKAKGYSMNYFDDNGETKVITEFENRIPLYLVPLDEFDKFLLQLQSDAGKAVQLQTFAEQLHKTELFQFYPILKDISTEGTLLNLIFTHRTLLNEKLELTLPHVRLLALLLCASTKRMKAEIFYQIVTGHNPNEKREVVAVQSQHSNVNSEAIDSDIFIDPLVYPTSESLIDCLIKLQELSFSMMILLHDKEIERVKKLTHDVNAQQQAMEAHGIRRAPPTVTPEDIPMGCQPEDSKVKWLSVADMQGIYKELAEGLLAGSIFGKEEKLAHEVFLQKLNKEHPEFLKSHQIRKFVFSRLVDHTFASKIEESKGSSQ